jgi:hypothetical protein
LRIGCARKTAARCCWPGLRLRFRAWQSRHCGPDKVFFRGQLAPTQLRNTGGERFADDFYVVAGLCGNSGYATDVK